MDNRKKIVLGVVIVSIFIFLTTVLVFVYALYSGGQDVPAFFRPFVEYHIHFMVLMGFFGVVSGTIVYNVLESSIEKEKRVVMANMDIIMKFLGDDDRSVVRLLLEKGGMTTQGAISALPGMTRLKAHRRVRKLEGRGIIHVEKHGKINMVRLVNELRGAGTE
ncbi:MAG TPA: hypothetical protein HA254_03125 [Candidatus Diapherotrites archaeon]|uniref:Uncharacterized protein n=1 Tax=Candidatus Iainarchaeum sp. TaxID=3101447 RepID=A0A7J4IXR0_9ARCH|nr:hypothetical protein [Candidatus Diapherotrites archaeon]